MALAGTGLNIRLMFFGLMLNAPMNNFSVMLGRSHRFLSITSTFGGKYVLLKDTTRQPELDSNPGLLNPESEVLTEVLTTRPSRPPQVDVNNTIPNAE